MIDTSILKTANGETPNGFSIFPDFSINKNKWNEYTVFTTIKTNDNNLLPIGAKDDDLTIAIIKLYKYAHSLSLSKEVS